MSHVTTPSSSVRGRDGAFGRGLRRRTTARAPPPPPPPPLWTGFYAGLSVGGAFGGSNSVSTSSANVADVYDPTILLKTGAPSFVGPVSAASQTGTANSSSSGGAIGGGQIGYNYQFASNFVAGIEADISGLNQRAKGVFVNSVTDPTTGATANGFVGSETAVDWLGTVRGRLGWLFTPTFLVFGDGGLAYGGVRANTGINASWTPGGIFTGGDAWTGASGGLSSTRAGWMAGGGLEWLFLPGWSLKIEYLYYSLGSASWSNGANSSFNTTNGVTNFDGLCFLFGTSCAPGSIDATNLSRSHARFNGNIVRAGLNYHFNWGAPPVIAKY